MRGGRYSLCSTRDTEWVVAVAMPPPPFLAHDQKQTRQCLENGKRSQPENDVYCLLSMLTISWRRKKKREADFAFPSLLRLAPPQNFQGHVPLLFSFFFFVVCCWSFSCCFSACVISLSSFPRLLSFFKINLKNETSREESVCAPAQQAPSRKITPKSSIVKKKNHLNATCVRRRHVHSVRKPKFPTQFRGIISQETQLRNAKTMGRVEGDEIEPPSLPGSTMCVQRIR